MGMLLTAGGDNNTRLKFKRHLLLVNRERFLQTASYDHVIKTSNEDSTDGTDRRVAEGSYEERGSAEIAFEHIHRNERTDNSAYSCAVSE